MELNIRWLTIYPLSIVDYKVGLCKQIFWLLCICCFKHTSNEQNDDDGDNDDDGSGGDDQANN